MTEQEYKDEIKRLKEKNDKTLDAFDEAVKQNQALADEITRLNELMEYYYGQEEAFDKIQETIEVSQYEKETTDNMIQYVTQQINDYEKTRLDDAKKLVKKEKELDEREKRVKTLQKSLKEKEAGISNIIEEKAQKQYNKLKDAAKKKTLLLMGYSIFATLIIIIMLIF